MVTLEALARRAPDKPIWRIKRSTVQRATLMFSRLSWAQILSAPQTNRFSSNTRPISTLSSSSRTARADGGRFLATQYVFGADPDAMLTQDITDRL